MPKIVKIPMKWKNSYKLTYETDLKNRVSNLSSISFLNREIVLKILMQNYTECLHGFTKSSQN